MEKNCGPKANLVEMNEEKCAVGNKSSVVDSIGIWFILYTNSLSGHTS